jgi:DNA-binding response OmpR family regulator
MSEAVLVIEDEYKLRELVRSYLEREGFVVYSTGSGAEAIEIGRRGGIGLVVLDLGLPDVPGEEVARELRKSSDVPVLVLTAKSEERSALMTM